MKILRYLKMWYTIRMKRNFCSYPPVQIHIEPTNYCNLDCLMCPNSKIKRKKGYMSMKVLKKIAAEDFYDTVALYLFGESMLHPKLDLMIKELKKNGKRVFFHTNGTLFNSNSEKILKSGLDAISISLHDKKSFPRVTKFLEKRKESGSRMPCYVESLDIEEERLSDEQIKELKRLGAKYSIKKTHTWRGLYGSRDKKNRKYYGCYHPFWMLCVGWDGAVVACCRDHNGDFIIGDVNKESLESIWNGKKMRQFRGNIHNQVSFEPCENCEKLYQPQFVPRNIIKEMMDRRKR